VNGGPDSDRQPAEPPADKAPTSLGDIPLADRWAPLVGNPEKPALVPPKLAQRLLASVLCLVVLALFLWSLS
jgi:hypothetical protein